MTKEGYVLNMFMSKKFLCYVTHLALKNTFPPPGTFQSITNVLCDCVPITIIISVDVIFSLYVDFVV